MSNGCLEACPPFTILTGYTDVGCAFTVCVVYKQLKCLYYVEFDFLAAFVMESSVISDIILASVLKAKHIASIFRVEE
jgi:hypothetical protein